MIRMKTSPLFLAVLLSVVASFKLTAGLAYWDGNDSTTGAGTNPNGIWVGSAFWSTDPLGELIAGVWTPGDTAVFSAGSDALVPFTVTGSGTAGAPGAMAAGIVVEEGFVTLVGGTVGLGAGPVTIKAGATLSTDSSLRISTTAGSVWTLDGGTARSTNLNSAGSFIDVDSTITLAAGGGTLSHTVAGILNIVQITTIISGPGSLTKTGAGVLAIASPSTYLGATFVNEGELRIRTTTNRLPITTAVTVNDPGILNLNSVSQRIGSLAGNGLVGLGNATLTVGDTASTIFSGSIRDIANAGASGTTSIRGKVTKVGEGTLTVTGVNTYSGLTQIDSGSIRLGGSERLSDLSNLRLNGGTFDSVGFNETLGTLDVDASSAIDFGSGNSALVFSDSDSQTWDGLILNIVNWTPGNDTFRVGADGSGFGAQLAHIQFADFGNAPAQIDANGFITPLIIVPEPSSSLLCTFAGIALLQRSRHRV